MFRARHLPLAWLGSWGWVCIYSYHHIRCFFFFFGVVLCQELLTQTPTVTWNKLDPTVLKKTQKIKKQKNRLKIHVLPTFVNKNLQSSKKTTTTTNKNASGLQPRVKSGRLPNDPHGVPTQPTHHLADPKPLWRSPPDPCGLAGDSFGWSVGFFCLSEKVREKIRKQSNKHVTNANAIFVETNEWIILVNYDIVHMFWFYWPPDISKHVQLIFGTMPFLR